MVLLMLTDVLLEGSQMLYVDDDIIINVVPKENATFDSHTMSRKMQVIPSLSARYG